MSYLVKIPLLVAMWGSFAHAGSAQMTIAQAGIDCGGKGWLSRVPSMSGLGYISLKLIPLNGVYDLILERTNSGHTVNISQTIAHGLVCKIGEAPSAGGPDATQPTESVAMLRVSCSGGTPASPLKFKVGGSQYGTGGYLVEAQSEAIVSAREEGFDGDEIWAADGQPVADNALRLLFAGGGFTCTALDQMYMGRSVSAAR